MHRIRFRTTFTMLVLAICLVSAGCEPQKGATKTVVQGKTTWTVYFSPDGGATDAIVRALSEAKKSVLVQAYSFTSAPIAEALVDAHKRGADVKVILDRGQVTAKYSSADFLQHAGIPTWIDSAHAIAHNKVMVIDDAAVVTGSFNFTKAAESKNAENLLIILDKELAGKYTENWKAHLEHSEKYEAKSD
jgi:phosphatidylserine/phosphatidylglycerophosphate/cardiolipin synthase-like enzyme